MTRGRCHGYAKGPIRRHRLRLRHGALELQCLADGGRPRHALRRVDASLLAAGRDFARCHRYPAKSPHAWRGSHPVSRQAWSPGSRAIRAARIAAPRSITGRWRSKASAAAIMAGCSTWKATVSNNPASPRWACTAIACGSHGTRWLITTASCLPIWGRPRKSRCCRVSISSRIWRRVSISSRRIPAWAAAATAST